MPTQKFYLPDLIHAQEPEVVEALRDVDGILFTVANHRDRCAEVEFEDDCVSVDDIVKCLERAGFQAEPAG